MSKLEALTAPLSKDDIELRVGMCNKNGFSLLLYKTARTDMKRLNDVFGLDWCNNHQVDNKGNVTCTIGVYNSETGQWVKREDTGTESNTEKEKGSYSDSFKRAGFRFGIGIELYKSPFIWVSGRVKEFKGRYVPDFRTQDLVVSEYQVVNGIPHLAITLKGDVVYSNMNGVKVQRQNEKPVQNKNTAKDKYETALPKVLEAVKLGGLQSMVQDKLAFIEEMRKARPDLHMKVMEANALHNK